MALPLLGMIGLPGSTLFPLISFPETALLAVYAAFMAVGVAWVALQRVRRPRMLADLKAAIDDVQLSFAVVRERAR